MPKCHSYPEPMLCNKRSHHNEKLSHCKWRVAPLPATGEKPYSNKDPAQTKLDKNKIYFLKNLTAIATFFLNFYFIVLISLFFVTGSLIPCTGFL